MIVFNSIFLFLFNLILTNAYCCRSLGAIQCNEDCTKIIACINHEELVGRTCQNTGSNTFCNSQLKSCVNESLRAYPGSCVPSSSKDIFVDDDIPCDYFIPVPHPTDCNKYYTCDDGIRKFHPCPKEKAYNPSSFKCDLKLSDNICTEGLTPVCNQSIYLQTGKVESNPRFYWNCTSYKVGMETYYKMKLRLCNDDEIYGGSAEGCVKSSESGQNGENNGNNGNNQNNGNDENNDKSDQNGTNVTKINGMIISRD